MPFEKGRSGNPGGRRRDKMATQELIIALNEQDGDANKLRKIIDALILKARDGDVPAINTIMDRVEGKVAQDIGLTVNSHEDTLERLERLDREAEARASGREAPPV